MKKTVVVMEFDLNEIDHMSDSSMANFIYQQPDRFSELSVDPGFASPTKKGSLHFFERYLELKVYQGVVKTDGSLTAIYSDDGEYSSWVLVVYKQRGAKK